MPQMWPSYWEMLTSLVLLIMFIQIPIYSKLIMKKKNNNILKISKKTKKNKW